MKKIKKIMITSTLMMLLFGCGISNSGISNSGISNSGISNNDNKTYLGGTEAAKVLLANERLDNSSLNDSKNIFNIGVKQLRSLAEKTKNSMKKLRNSNNNYEGITIEGDVYFWDGQMPNNSNSYDYFENLSGGVIFYAEQGANLIDYVKKNIRILDKWVGNDSNRYLLTVEENSETIYQLIQNSIFICRRAKNAEGNNVYDMTYYTLDGEKNSRMKYIPDKVVEFINGNQRFYADKSKGYWDVISVYSDDTDTNIQTIDNFVMKDDLCYQYVYEVESDTPYNIKLISSDAQTDIMTIYGDGSFVTLYASGFDGLKGFRLECPEDKITEEYPSNGDAYLLKSDDSYTILGNVSPSLVLADDRIIEPNTSFFNDKVKFFDSYISFCYPMNTNGIYTAEMNFGFDGDTIEERTEYLKKIIEELGMTCRRDLNTIINGYYTARSEVYYDIKYKTWNGYSINSLDEMAKGLEEEKQKIIDLVSLYDEVKDREIIDSNNQEEMEKNITFAAFKINSSASVEIQDLNVVVDDLEVTTNDTRLFVENEQYIVNLALAETSNYKTNLIHINASELEPTTYNGGMSFTIVQDGTYEIPYVKEGEYVLVAYISTHDGIRVTLPEIITIDNFVEQSYQNSNTVLSLNIIGDNQVLKYTNVNEIFIGEINVDEIDQLLKIFEENAYKYGLPSNEKIQYLSDSNWIDLDETQALSNITVRFKFLTEDGIGYVYANLA